MEAQTPFLREGVKLLREEFKIRLAVLLVVFLFWATSSFLLRDRWQYYALAASAGLFVLGLIFSRFSRARLQQLGAQQLHVGAVALAVLDLSAVTLLLYATWALYSPFFVFYLVALIFAAIFFRGLELALLTGLTIIAYFGMSWSTLIDGNAFSLWHFSGRTMGLILIAWYAYSLAEVLRREKEANDQLLRHLAEGILLCDAQQRVSIVNETLLKMLDMKEEQLIGQSCAALSARDKVLSWLLADVGQKEGSIKTRTGCFPEADLPLVECSTIPCRANGEIEGWLIVCRDLRDLKAEPRTLTRSACDKLAPLAYLRSLSEALCGMAEYLDENRRWQVIEAIGEHTLALQSLLAEILHADQAEEEKLDLQFVEVGHLLASTRRLLEIQAGLKNVEVEWYIPQGLPPINVDRARLGQSLLQLCRAMVAVAEPEDKLLMDVRAGENTIIFSFALVNKYSETIQLPEAVAENGVSCPLPEDIASLPIFRVIEEHHGRWECAPVGAHLRRITFELPIAGPALPVEAAASAFPHKEESSRPLTKPPVATLSPALTAELANQLRNSLSVLRGNAEWALRKENLQELRQSLAHIVEITDYIASLADTLSPGLSEVPEELITEARPASQTEEEEAATAAEKPSAAPAARLKVAPYVLIVEDDSGMRDLLSKVLADSGYEVKSVSEGHSAIETLRLHPPALAFVDLSLPRISGAQVLREARKYAPDTAIVLMTGYALRVALEVLGEDKPYALLRKPFAMEEVLTLAQAVLGKPVSSAR